MKKQIVFLMTDTTRKDMVGCYGNPKMKTPASLWTGKKCNFYRNISA